MEDDTLEADGVDANEETGAGEEGFGGDWNWGGVSLDVLSGDGSEGFWAAGWAMDRMVLADERKDEEGLRKMSCGWEEVVAEQIAGEHVLT